MKKETRDGFFKNVKGIRRQDDIPEDAILVCGGAGIGPVSGHCDECAAPISWSEIAPTVGKKVCVDCMIKLVEADGEGPVEVAMTGDQLDEVTAVLGTFGKKES